MDGRTPLTVSVGTGGYAWPEWVGPFYPATLPEEEFLGYYASHFPFVELHSTSVRPPPRGLLARLASHTPAPFQFLLQVPRSATHEGNIHEWAPFLRSARELIARHRLLGFVLEFPDTVPNTPRRRAWVERLSGDLKPHPIWCDFHHPSWHAPRALRWLGRSGLDLAGSDRQEDPEPLLLPGTRHAYLRLRQPRPEPVPWALNWLERARQRTERLQSAHVVLAIRDAGPRLEIARNLVEALRNRPADFQFVEPPRGERTVQGQLFQAS